MQLDNCRAQNAFLGCIYVRAAHAAQRAKITEKVHNPPLGL